MKRILMAGLGGLLLFVVVAVVHASPVKRLDPATKTCRVFRQITLWEGYNTFKSSCKSCHYRGNDKGARFLHTESKTMRGWNRVFAKKYPQCAKSGEWAGIEQEQMMRLNDYLYKKAADSYDPYDAADCG